MSDKTHSRTGLIIAAFAFVASIVLNLFNNYTTAELCASAQKNLHSKETKARQALQILGHLDKNKPFESFSKTDKEFLDHEDLSLFAFQNDSLVFWSANTIPLDYPVAAIKENNGMLHLRNGWYEYILEKEKELKKLALIFVKPEYDVQNNYFDNDFAPWMQLPAQTKLREVITRPENAVKSITGKSLFEIVTNEKTMKNEGRSACSVILFFISILGFVFYGLQNAFRSKISLTKFSIISILIVGLRALMIWLKWPGLLYSTALFMPGDYGNPQSFFNEFLGDILINVFLFLAWTSLFYKSVELNFKNSIMKVSSLVLYFGTLTLLAHFLNLTVKNLVFNSTIPFEFSNFFNLNQLSFLSLGIVFLNGFSIAILIEKFIAMFLNENYKNRNWVAFCILIYSGLYFLFKEKYNAIEWFWLPGLFVFSVFLRKYNFMQSILSSGFRILIFALITSWLFSTYNSERERSNTTVLADNLSDRQDAILESEFSGIANKIKADPRFKKALYRLPLFNNETEQQLRRNYFTGYFEKFNVQLAVFDSVCMPHFKNSDLIYNNNEYFEDQVLTGMPTISENLYFMDSYKLNSRYIGKIEFDKPEGRKAPYILYVQLEPKQVSGGGGFPDLLLDEGQQKQNRYKQISYAVYKQNKLASSYGQYDYPQHNVDSVQLNKANGNFKHYFVSPDKETLIVLSTKIKDFNYFFTTNSYYFIFYSLLGLIMLVVAFRIDDRKLNFFSLNRRIQVFTISILFFALLAIGIFTVKLVINKSKTDNLSELAEKAGQINNELNSVLLEEEHLDANGREYTEGLLKKLALLFNSDISLYNANGVLFASSRPQLFDAGLSSRLINPLAIANFSKNESSNFGTQDKIGTLNYLSLYKPLFNKTGVLIGYLNLPYFARQSDLEEGLSDYITTLLNVYVILFLVSLFTGLIVTAYVTKPLRIVQQQLAKISLGKRNEPIAWESNDEIGGLVNEYNLMLLKLEESANLLAKSEREGAWQEMAKQVAHEIKNPLTPMKLNLQYLQKVVNEGGEDFEGKFKKVASSMIEQIDTLAHIANEFSNFAKMPKVNFEQVNLTEVIRSTIELFKNENVNISFESEINSANVLADKNQSLRVFNNIIKNAIQSIPESRQGKIEINMRMQDGMILVSIKDNGCGIPESMKEKIFVPNFTTKSHGTGLGLAMVKNIITAFGGSIWFSSNENEGTIFYLTFRK